MKNESRDDDDDGNEEDALAEGREVEIASFRLNAGSPGLNMARFGDSSLRFGPEAPRPSFDLFALDTGTSIQPDLGGQGPDRCLLPVSLDAR